MCSERGQADYWKRIGAKCDCRAVTSELCGSFPPRNSWATHQSFYKKKADLHNSHPPNSIGNGKSVLLNPEVREVLDLRTRRSSKALRCLQTHNTPLNESLINALSPEASANSVAFNRSLSILIKYASFRSKVSLSRDTSFSRNRFISSTICATVSIGQSCTISTLPSTWVGTRIAWFTSRMRTKR